MATHPHNTAGRPQGPFHKVGLSFGSAGALVRLAADDKLHSVAAAWVRTRKGNTDKVFMTLPQQLLGPAEELVKCVTITGDAQRKRVDFNVVPESRICGMLETTSDGGSYAVVYMQRVGQNAEFETKMYRLDHNWRPIISTGKNIGNIANWLHEDFLEHARDIPSAWPIMYAASALFGGQGQAELDRMFEGKSGVAAPTLPADLATALDDERRFRANSRKVRALSPQAAAEFRNKLSPEQVAAFDALLKGERTYA